MIGTEHLPVGDEDLMMLIKDDDAQAFATFFDRHSAVAFGLAMRILDDRDLAVDATQEAFLGIWRSRASYRVERGDGRAWLLVMVRQRAIDTWRRAHHRAVLDGEKLFARRDMAACTEDQPIARDKRLSMRLLLDDLPLEQRRVLELAFFGGFSHTQISRHLRLPLGTAKRRMRLALEKLRGARDAEQTITTNRRPATDRSYERNRPRPQ